MSRSSSRTLSIRRQASLIAVGGDSFDGVVGETTGGGVGVTTVVETGGGVAGVGDGTYDGAGRGGVADAFVVVRVAAERFAIGGAGGWGRGVAATRA